MQPFSFSSNLDIFSDTSVLTDQVISALNPLGFTIAGKRFLIIWGTGVVSCLICVCVSQIRPSPLRWRDKASTPVIRTAAYNSEKPQFSAHASLFQAQRHQRRVLFIKSVSVLFILPHFFILPHIHKCGMWLRSLVSLTGDARPKIKADLTIIMSALNPAAWERLSWDCWQHPQSANDGLARAAPLCQTGVKAESGERRATQAGRMHATCHHLPLDHTTSRLSREGDGWVSARRMAWGGGAVVGGKAKQEVGSCEQSDIPMTTSPCICLRAYCWAVHSRGEETNKDLCACSSLCLKFP